MEVFGVGPVTPVTFVDYALFCRTMLYNMYSRPVSCPCWTGESIPYQFVAATYGVIPFRKLNYYSWNGN